MKLMKKFSLNLMDHFKTLWAKVNALNDRARLIDQRINEMRSKVRERYSLGGGGWHQ